jgi:hypothetical protein
LNQGGEVGAGAERRDGSVDDTRAMPTRHVRGASLELLAGAGAAAAGEYDAYDGVEAVCAGAVNQGGEVGAGAERRDGSDDDTRAMPTRQVRAFSPLDEDDDGAEAALYELVGCEAAVDAEGVLNQGGLLDALAAGRDRVVVDTRAAPTRQVGAEESVLLERAGADDAGEYDDDQAGAAAAGAAEALPVTGSRVLTRALPMRQERVTNFSSDDDAARLAGAAARAGAEEEYWSEWAGAAGRLSLEETITLPMRHVEVVEERWEEADAGEAEDTCGAT